MKPGVRILVVATAAVLLVGAGFTSVAAQQATIQSEDVTISNVGDTGQSAVTVDASNGVGIANVEVTVDTSVAEITNVEAGADVNSSAAAVNFNVENRTADSVSVEYADIGANQRSTSGFELAIINLTAVGAGNATVRLSESGIYDGDSTQYSDVALNEGNFNTRNTTSRSTDGGQDGSEGTQENTPGFTVVAALVAISLVVRKHRK